jgi:hypothetical protein
VGPDHRQRTEIARTMLEKPPTEKPRALFSETHRLAGARSVGLVDALRKISLLVKLKLANCARPGNRAGLSAEHRKSIEIEPAGFAEPEHFLQPSGRCMAPAPSRSRSIVSGLYFQWPALWSHAPSLDRGDAIDHLSAGPACSFSCCLQGKQDGLHHFVRTISNSRLKSSHGRIDAAGYSGTLRSSAVASSMIGLGLS